MGLDFDIVRREKSNTAIGSAKRVAMTDVQEVRSAQSLPKREKNSCRSRLMASYLELGALKMLLFGDGNPAAKGLGIFAVNREDLNK